MKTSKSCKYTGHMKIMNRVDLNKRDLDSQQSKLNMRLEHDQQEKHAKKGSGIVYPEDKCICKK